MTDQLPVPANEPPEGHVLIYRDGAMHLQVRLDGQTVWLPQRLIAELFQVTVPNVNQHLKAIYADGELRTEATIKQYLIVQSEGNRQVSRLVDHYNLDAILAVGFRVRSARGTQFRQWATAVLAVDLSLKRQRPRREHVTDAAMWMRLARRSTLWRVECRVCP